MSAEFSLVVLISFLIKIDIIGSAMLIWVDSDEGQVKFLQLL